MDKTKKRIVEIVELGFPQSIIQRGGEPISELIKTDDLVDEINGILEEFKHVMNGLSNRKHN